MGRADDGVDDSELERLRAVYRAAQQLALFLGQVMTADPRSSPVAFQARGPHAELYAAALHDRLHGLWTAIERAEAPIANGHSGDEVVLVEPKAVPAP